MLSTFIMLASGCTYTAVPRPALSASNTDSVRLNGAVVTVANAEKDNTLSRIRTAESEESSFKANRQAWCRVLVESLARELARRGASVRSQSNRIFTLTLPDIVFVESRDAYQFRVKAAISSQRGWSKEYTGSASVTATSVLSVQEEANSLAGQALANVLQQIVNDDDFIRQVRAQ